ncbi:PilT/PilU family type 4a pilus ATPase [Candidatus Shapirobacteria bacterium]|nr:PilT/PilU family type 4a pilus ATPase [Candidatus Shapirobacteria bacterium]
MNIKIKQILELAVANGASDIHLSVSTLPKLRVNGELIDIANFDISNPLATTEMILSLLSDDQRVRFSTEKELDFSVTLEEARFRVNMFLQRSEVRCTLRVVSSTIPSFKELKLPDIFSEIVNYKQGCVLVTGPTGHGKSTTVASVLNRINEERKVHMVTVEDPIEYILKPNNSVVSQRELGNDTLSFAAALKSVLRQDPNVVFVGEMRDLETITSALTIAETGHLVFSTLHTNSAAQTVDRIVDVFPEGSKDQIKVQLASVITAIVSQRLIPAIDGGRVPVFEILMATPAVKNAIRDGKSFMLDNIIQTSADLGMVGLETSLSRLVHQGKITEEVAMSYSLRPSELQSNLRSLKKL